MDNAANHISTKQMTVDLFLWLILRPSIKFRLIGLFLFLQSRRRLSKEWNFVILIAVVKDYSN